MELQLSRLLDFFPLAVGIVIPFGGRLHKRFLGYSNDFHHKTSALQ